MTRFEIKGGREISQALKEIPIELREKSLRKAMRNAGKVWRELVEQNARRLGPGEKNKRTGNIRLGDSIILKRTANPDIEQADEFFQVSYNAKAYWGLFVELGTKKMPAQPFLAPVLDNHSEDAVLTARDSLQRDLARIARQKARKTNR